MKSNRWARVTAEFLGTAFLVAAVVGSGITAERLANGNKALALLANTVATGAALVALILAFGPISGAHFNPVVSLVDAMEEGGLSWSEALPYIAAQLSGGISGTISAHAMFGLALISPSRQRRALCGGDLHCSSVLVYGINILRESCGDDCEVTERHVCGHSSQRRSVFRHRASRRWCRSDDPVSLV
jgi:glycerol uptake facilitator-like aquaporin